MVGAILQELPLMPNQLRQTLQSRIDGKTKPLGSLGRLEQLALRLGLIQQNEQPRILQPSLVVFAADHGAANAGISAYPQDVTWQMVLNYLQGGAAVNVFARQAGWNLLVVDAGVKHDFGTMPGLLDRKIAAGTANYLHEPAMTAAQCEQALAAGRAIVAGLAAQGCTLLGLGEMGIGNTASASLLAHRLLGLPLADLVGRGTGLDDAGLARKTALLEQASARCPESLNAFETLRQFGGFEIAMICGAMLEAAERRIAILVDGFIVTAALLVARDMAPSVTDACLYAHCSEERGHRLLLRHLQAEPLLDLGLRLGEGTGAALALPLVQAAAAFLAEMASFDDAGVSKQSAS